MALLGQPSELPDLSREKIVFLNHKLNSLFTKVVRSSLYMDISLVRFCAFMNLDCVSVHQQVDQYPAILITSMYKTSFPEDLFFPNIPLLNSEDNLHFGFRNFKNI